MSFHLISTVARYEMRTLLRSWFFRIFVGLAIIGLGIFNVAMNVEASGAPWIYKALAASIPYANLIILNLGQAIVAVFLASEFLKQDKKNDSVEVIYARSMTNGQYILGKTLGILAVFLVLNIIVLVMGIGFSFLNNTATRDIWSYFIYPLLISLPTLVFILGLSFFLMVLIKNQAVTFIILLGYIALTIFYLNKELFHIYDYIGYNVPMMFSSISGFADVTEIVYHRLIYFLIGIGLIFLTIYKLQRLPQPANRNFIPLAFGLIFLFSGGFFVMKYLNLKYSVQEFKKQAIELNNQYCYYPKVTVKKCDLNLEHLPGKIAVDAKLLIENLDSLDIDTLILSLNPALKVESVNYNQSPVTFTRKMHLILIKVPSTLLQGEGANIEIKYAGTINERICFLDKTGENAEDNFNTEVFTLRKRYAFLQDDYVCLTSESFWYPVSWTGYATKKPMYYNTDLVDYSLQVKTAPGLIAISQGKSKDNGKGIFTFAPEFPLPKLSLLIGPYQKSSVKVDSVEYNIYSMSGQDYYLDVFKNLSDTVSNLISGMKQEYEAEIGFKYPYKRFSLIEIPVHFALDKHEYSYSSEAVQPEMVLCNEKGVAFNSSDFRNRRYRVEREMKRNNEESLPEEVQSRIFKQFVKNNLLARSDQYYIIHGTDWKTFSLFPQYYTFVSPLQTEKWPILSIAMESYFNERTIKKGKSALWYEDLSREEKINLEMNGQSLEDLFITGIHPSKDEDNPFQLRDVVLTKGNDLFNLLRARYGEKEIDTLLTELAINHPFKKIPFENLNQVFLQRLQVNLDSLIESWYFQKTLPSFNISELSTYKVVQGEETKYQLIFTVTNPEIVDGLITVNIEENNPNRKNENWWDDNFEADVSRKVFMPAHSSREVGFLFSAEPKRMSIVTHVSKNLPNNLVFNLSGFNEIRNGVKLDDVRVIPFVSSQQIQDEVTIDNEDQGFSYQQATNQAYLKSLIDKNRKPRYKYSRLRSWNPDREWKAVLRSEFFGQSVHSSYYTRAGSGERKAVWTAVLPESNSYDVYFYMNKPTFGWRRSNKSPDYNITVYHDGGTEKINQSSEGVDNGWLYLGTFQISSDTAKVELSNKSNGDMIFADAVKWVKVK